MRKTNQTLAVVLAFVPLLMVQCSSSSSQSLQQLSEEYGAPVDVADVQVDIFMARGHSSGSDFERYHVDGEMLWRECGSVLEETRGTDGTKQNTKQAAANEIFPQDSNVTLKEKSIEFLEQDQLEQLYAKIAGVLDERKKTSEIGPPPGSIFSFAEPGLVEVRIGVASQRASVVTSVDATAEAELPALRDVKSLVEYLRSFGEPMCNARTFFGLGRDA